MSFFDRLKGLRDDFEAKRLARAEEKRILEAKRLEDDKAELVRLRAKRLLLQERVKIDKALARERASVKVLGRVDGSLFSDFVSGMGRLSDEVGKMGDGVHVKGKGVKRV